MPALVAGIHVLHATRKTWMAGTRPAMTKHYTIGLVSSPIPEIVTRTVSPGLR